MKRIKRIFISAAVLLGAACSSPKIVPDGELAQIFHDVYLTNAYTDSRRAGLDSLNVYEPIFARYGYTSEDIRYTIGNFSKRKSARLSDVVDRAIEMLRSESRFYADRIAVADTITQIARRKFASVVYSDSLIIVGRIADTARLRITLPVEPGTYELTYDYMVDSTDQNPNLRTNVYLLDEGGRRSGNIARRLRNAARESVKSTLMADKNHTQLVIDLNGYGEDMTTPHMRVDSLVVMYYLPDDVARDSMARGWFDRTVLDSLFTSHETNIVTPFADSTGTRAR